MELEKLVAEVKERIESGDPGEIDEIAKKLHELYPSKGFYHDYISEYKGILDIVDRAAADLDDMAKLILFSFAVFDCNKHQIDYPAVKEALGIDILIKKYAADGD